MADRNALRRLKAILEDEEYGPKLARLNRADERKVLDLIESNPGGRGKAYRDEIIRLDKARLDKARQRRQVKKAPQVDIDALRQRAYVNMRRVLDGKPQTIKRGVSLMTIEEALFAAKEGPWRLKDRAREPTRKYIVNEQEIEINPFWYK